MWCPFTGGKCWKEDCGAYNLVDMHCGMAVTFSLDCIADALRDVADALKEVKHDEQQA